MQKRHCLIFSSENLVTKILSVKFHFCSVYYEHESSQQSMLKCKSPCIEHRFSLGSKASVAGMAICISACFAVNFHASNKSCILSPNNTCFQCNIAITNFLVLHTCAIRFHDVIGQSTVHMHSYAKILKHGWSTWPNKYVLDPFFSI